MTKHLPPRLVFHVDKGQPYHIEDSLRGIKLAIAKACKWIDLDCHSTKDGVLVITHWGRPDHEGFKDPAGNVKVAGRRIEDMTWAEVRTLRVADNYRISRADVLVPWAIKHGIGVELEAKSATLTVDQFTALRKVVTDAGLDVDRLQVKAFAQFLPSLRAAHQAGATTFVLTHKRGETLPATAQAFLDYWRGFQPTWADRAPKPYEKTQRDGHTIDQLTNYALYATERRLSYTPGSLTVVQGSYNAGGVSASAGTHDGGGVVDLTAQNWEQKVHALRAVGFAAWHRPPNWDGAGGGEHIHAVLIGNAKLSDSAARQVTQYRNHTNGLANFGADNTWHPDPIPTFIMPKWAADV